MSEVNPTFDRNHKEKCIIEDDDNRYSYPESTTVFIDNNLKEVNIPFKQILDNIKDLDPEFSKLVDKYFWDLI